MTAQLDLSQTQPTVDIWAFLDTLFGQRHGYVVAAIGRNPYRDANGKYRHRHWEDHKYYQWPADLDRMLNELGPVIGDTYFCPALRASMNRDKNGALPPTTCWVDLDELATDPALLSTLQPLTAHSGSENHQHVYIPLTREIDLVTHGRINKRLADLLGGDVKWADNSLLRLPGTWNYKPTVPLNGSAPRPRVFVSVNNTTPRCWDPIELMRLLGLSFDGQAQMQQQVIAPPISYEDVDFDKLHPVVKDRLAIKDTDDRSGALHALVGACRARGYSHGQTLTIARTYEPGLSKYGDRIDAEITRCWGRVDPPCEVDAELGPPPRPQGVPNNLPLGQRQQSASNSTPPAQSQQLSRRVELTAASTIKPKRALWLWEGRIPLGELSLLAGREGIGKSTVCYQLASSVTKGILPGEFKGQGRPVIVIATEDSWAHTIVPRLMAAEADLDKVFRAEVITSDNIVTGLSLPADTERLKEQINQVGAAMVLLDPLISRLDAKLDTHKDADVRVALEPLVQLAHDCSVAVLGLIHVNKSGTTDPLNSVMGSKAFAAVARSVLYCVVDPEDDTEQRKLLGMPKNNLGRTDLPTLAFQIENTFVCNSEDGPIYSGRIEWLDEMKRSLRDVLETGQRDGETRSAVNEAKDWLSDYLKEIGPLGCPSSQAKKDGIKMGHAKATIERAAKQLSILIKPVGFPRQTWWYLMPDDEADMSDISGMPTA